MTTDWNPLLRDQFELPYWHDLQQFVAQTNAASTPSTRPPTRCSPPCTSRRSPTSRSMILGQDPYHGPGTGPRAVLLGAPRGAGAAVAGQHPQGAAQPTSAWRSPTTATSRPGPGTACCCSTPRSPCAAVRRRRTRQHGWETFTDQVIRVVNAKDDPVVFILWGALGAPQASADRHRPAHDHRVGASVAAVGPQRVLRQPTVQPGECGARRRRARSCRLGSERPGKHRRMRMQR